MEMKPELAAFGRLLDIMDELREKCPWDKEQTMESIRHLTIEETYELSDAILKEDLTEIKKELGDILLHIVFYARIGREKEAFNITDIINSLNEKLIRRHPHVYGETSVENSSQVKTNWEQIKMTEGKESALSGVPDSLPSLLKAYRIQDKARGVGFDWERPEQVLEKVHEELEELKKEVNDGNMQKAEDELGDLIFSLINYARFLKINPEDALSKTNNKFIFRFKHLEKRAKEQGKTLKDMTLAEMDVYWEEAKHL